MQQEFRIRTRVRAGVRVRHLVCAILAAAALAAPFAEAAADAPAATPPPLEGTTWRLTRMRGEAPPAGAETATLRLEGGRVSAFAGCNRLAGGYSIAGDRLRLGPLAGTMMACPEPAASLEKAYVAALAGELAFRIEDARLTLSRAGEAAPALVFEMAPPPRVEGVVWEVTGYNNGRQAVVGPLAGTSLTLEFEDGFVTGDAGCNRFRASATRDGGRLAIGPPAATRKACPGEGVMEQEREFLAALETAKTWTIDDRGMLDVHRADGERVLVASPKAK